MRMCRRVCPAVILLGVVWAVELPAEEPPKPLAKVVAITFPKDGYTFTLAEAAKGIKLDYEIAILKETEGVTPLPFGPSFAEPAGASGMFPRVQISGDGQFYCLQDFGLAFPPKGKVVTLKKGSYKHSIEWDGRNWNGPSDTGNPKGKPFPAGTYDVIVKVHGTLKTDKGEVPYQFTATSTLVLK